jgi:hypothetical protein
MNSMSASRFPNPRRTTSQVWTSYRYCPADSGH